MPKPPELPFKPFAMPGRRGRQRTKPVAAVRNGVLRDDALVSLTALHLANDLIDCTGSLDSARATLELIATLRR